MHSPTQYFQNLLPAYFAMAVSYVHKIFMYLTSGACAIKLCAVVIVVCILKARVFATAIRFLWAKLGPRAYL
jgi:hypothetical protein